MSRDDGRPLVGLLRWSYVRVVAPLVLALLAVTAGQLLVQRQFRVLTDQARPLADAAARSLQQLTDAQTGARGYELSRRRPFLEPYQRGLRLYPLTMAEARRAAAGDATALRLLDGQDRAASRWITEFARPAAAGAAPDPILDKRLFDPVRAANRAVVDHAEGQLAAAERRARWTLVGSVLVAALLGLLALAYAARSARRVTRAVGRPVDDVVRTLREVARGDFAARAALAGPQELRQIAASVNALGEEAERMVAQEEARRRRDEVVRAVERGMLGSLDTVAALSAATAALGAGLEVDRAYVRLVEDGRPGGAVALWPPDAEPPPTAPGLPWSPTADPADPYAVIAVDDVAAGAGADRRAVAGAAGVTAYLTAPLRTGSELVGLLTLEHCGRSRAWTGTEQEVAAQAGREMALALGHVRAVEKQREAVERLTALDRIREAFVSTVSHELRTPLTSIAGYVELLREEEAGPLTAVQARMLGTIDRNTVRLRALIDDLLTLSSVDAGRFRLESVPVDLAEVVEQAVTAMRPVAEAGQLALAYQAPPAELHVIGDQVNLERAVLNLLSNAVKYTRPGGRVTVTARADGGAAVVEVADTGIGIPAADQGQLFGRFFRAANAREGNLPGTGLGLALVRELVLRHQGEVDLRSEEGVGTTVTIRLPLRNVAAPVGVR